ncbi:MAG: PIN domain-containing protein [Bacteroidales bacterium]|jgi:predicted nucleic acid-binding protein|nr:PIN domain-containing protein [Bacteroidales bacterium]
MVKAFIDTNVLMDLFLWDRPEKPVAKIVFSSAQAGLFQAHISSQSIIDTAYSAKKHGMDFETFKSILQQLRSFVKILAIDYVDLLWAESHHSGDFEDDAQYASAYNGVCDYFITRDQALLKLNSPLCPMKVITPSDFVAAMEAED